MNTKRWGIVLVIGGWVALIGGYLLAVFLDVPFIPFLVSGIAMTASGWETIRRARRAAAPSN
jgi:hypothetical protein